MANAECVIVDVGALKSLELLNIMVVCGVESIAVILERRKRESECVAGAPEGLLFIVKCE